MGEKKEPQSFAHVLAEADGGLLNRQISDEWQDLSDDLDGKSMLHDVEAKGEITITLLVKNDHGKVLIEPKKIAIKKPPKQFTRARFYRTEAGNLTTQDPRVAGDLFAEKRAEREAKAGQGKSAAVPKVGGA